MRKAPPATRVLQEVLIAAVVFGGLYLASWYSFLLFHSIAELFSIVVACGIFFVAWNSRRFWEGGFFLFLGVAYLFVGGMDLVHTLAYTGMGVFPGYATNLPTQLWIAARYLESISLFVAPLLLGRRLNAHLVSLAYLAVCALVLLMIFPWNVFPVCFVEGSPGYGGYLTPFKKISEYVICAILAAAGSHLVIKRRHFDRLVVQLTVWSIIVTIFSELSFTLYRHAYGIPNLIGHYLKIVSFYLIYKAIIETALTKPYSILFRDLKQAQDSLRRARDELEQRVQERTAELAYTVTSLESEVRERTRAEAKLDQERRRLFSLLQVLPGYVALTDKDYNVRFANDKFLELFGAPGRVPCHKLLKGQSEPCHPCPVMGVLESQTPNEWEWAGSGGHAFQTWGYPFSDVDGTRLVLQLGIDVTERKRLEAEVLKISETERRRVGQDLHDSLGQALSGISCLSQVLHRKLSARSIAEADEAAIIESMLADAVGLTRSLARGLSPVGDKPDSLMLALNELASNVENMFRVRCVVKCDGPVPIGDSMVATHLYRIAQEAANNAARHGKARTITMELALSDGAITLRVEDDGVGLPEDATRARGLGLHIMNYRARTIGASIDFLRKDKGGTVVACRLKQTSPRECDDER